MLMLRSLWRRFALTTRGSSTLIGLRPPRRPRALAAAKPACVLSWMRRRSNCARLEKMLNISSPDAVVVSMAPSCSDPKPTPRNTSPRPLKTLWRRLSFDDKGVFRRLLE